MATVIGGTSCAPLAKKLAKKIGASYAGAKIRTFSDGESKATVRLSRRPGRIIIVQSASPPVDSNLLQALVLTEMARQSSPDVTAVIPYMGYSRQDRQFLAGEAVTIRAVARLFRAAGAKKIVTVDVHSSQALGYFGSASSVSAAPALAGRVKKMRLKSPLVVSPDSGGGARAARFAGLIGAEHASLEKKRDRRTGRVRIATSRLDQAAGRDVILYDDMISTGGSIVKAAEFLKRKKCRRIVAACTHALLVDGAEKRIKKAGVWQVVGTNTVPGLPNAVDVSGAIAGAVS